MKDDTHCNRLASADVPSALVGHCFVAISGRPPHLGGSRAASREKLVSAAESSHTAPALLDGGHAGLSSFRWDEAFERRNNYFH